jgi:hypothetical protein
MRQFTLRNSVLLDQGAHDGELIRGDVQVSGATPEGLVEAVPGAAQERWQALPFGRING